MPVFLTATKECCLSSQVSLHPFIFKHCGCVQPLSLGPGMFVDVDFLHFLPVHFSGSSSFNDLTDFDSYLDAFSCWSPEHFPTFKRESPVQVLSVEAHIVPKFLLTSSILSTSIGIQPQDSMCIRNGGGGIEYQGRQMLENSPKCHILGVQHSKCISHSYGSLLWSTGTVGSFVEQSHLET